MTFKINKIFKGEYKAEYANQIFYIEMVDEGVDNGWWDLFVMQGSTKEWSQRFSTKAQCVRYIKAKV